MQSRAVAQIQGGAVERAPEGVEVLRGMHRLGLFCGLLLLLLLVLAAAVLGVAGDAEIL